MSAKERHKQKVKQRIQQRLEAICSQEDILHSIIRDYVQKAQTRAQDLLATEDTSYFMQRYGSVEQFLDRVNNTCELLSTTAEDMIENAELDVTVKPDTSFFSMNESLQVTQHPEKLTGTEAEAAAQKNVLPKTSTPDDKQWQKKDQSSQKAVLGQEAENRTMPEKVQMTSHFDKLSQWSRKDEEMKKSLQAMLQHKNEENNAAVKYEEKKEAEKPQTKITDKTDKTTSRKLRLENSNRNNGLSNIVKQRGPRTIPGPVKKSIAHYIGENVTDKHKSDSDKTEPVVDFKRNTSTPVDDNVAPFETILEQDEHTAEVGEEIHDKVGTTGLSTKSGNVSWSTDKRDFSLTSAGNVAGTSGSSDKTDSTITSASLNTGVDKPGVFSSKADNDNKVIHEAADKSESNKADIAEGGSVDPAGRSDNLNNPESREGTAADVAEIEQSSLPSGKVCPVIVSDISSPWCFCVQFNASEVNHLMEQICTYMSRQGLHQDPITNPHTGQYCLAKFSKDTTYYRASILQCFQSTKEVEVLFIDYGNRERVKTLYLRELPQRFYNIPMQAVCCSLAEVMPNNKYMLWTEEDSLVFKQYVMNQQLNCVQACKCSTPGVPLIVRLFGSYPIPALPGGSVLFNQIIIGEVLVNRGSAKYVNTVDQIGHLQKSGEGKEESLILNKSASQGTVVEIHEPVSGTSDKHVQAETGLHKLITDSAKKLEKNTESDNRDKIRTEAGKDKKPYEDNSVQQSAKVKDCEKGNVTPTSTRSKSPIYTWDTDKGVKLECQDISNKNLNKESAGNKNDKTDVTKIKESESQNTVQNVDCGVDIRTDMTKQTDRNDADIVKEEQPFKMPRERSGYADSETMSSAGTTDRDSERSTDTGFQSTEVTFDLQLDPQGEKVMLAHVKSPTHFYVHVLQAGRTLDLLMKSLNKHFEKMNRRKLTRLSQTFVPVVNKLCCAQFLQDNSFYRAVILQIRSDSEPSGTGKVFVHYVDFGDQEWLPKRRLFPLPPHYSSVPSLAIRCKLAYIKPADLGEDNQTSSEDYTWSESCTKAFVDLVGFEKVLHMQVVEGHLTSNNKGELVGNDNETLGVYLVDTSGTEDICANMDLIRQNYAVLDVPENRKGFQDENANEELDIDNWNPMEADFLSKRNNYKFDNEDIEMATLGYRRQPERGVCRYFSKGLNCWRGESCPYRHVQSDSVVPLEREEVYCLENQVLPKVHSWVAAEVMTILTPGHFYILLPMGNKSLDAASTDSGQDENANMDSQESLDDLLTSLNVEYNQKSAHDRSLQLKALGEIVVARFSQDKQWYRARVIEVTENKVKVFYLDFGNTEWISEDEVMEIMPEFLHLPFQAVECFLCNVEPADDEKWTADAKSAFRTSVDGKTLVAHIRSRFWSGSLSVDLYDTSGDEDINVGDQLITDGHAIRSNSLTDSSCNGSVSSQSDQANSELSEIIIPG